MDVLNGSVQHSANQGLATHAGKPPEMPPTATSILTRSRTLKCKQVAKQPKLYHDLSHSKRRISTGSRRAAARAGTTVARRDIPIATTEIHTPSLVFGWKGTNGTAYT